MAHVRFKAQRAEVVFLVMHHRIFMFAIIAVQYFKIKFSKALSNYISTMRRFDNDLSSIKTADHS